MTLAGTRPPTVDEWDKYELHHRARLATKPGLVSFDTFIRNYEGKDVLSKSDVLEKDKKLRGQNYLAKMILLAKCKYLISSMTQGSKFSYVLNDGKYVDTSLYDALFSNSSIILDIPAVLPVSD